MVSKIKMEVILPKGLKTGVRFNPGVVTEGFQGDKGVEWSQESQDIYMNGQKEWSDTRVPFLRGDRYIYRDYGSYRFWSIYQLKIT